MLEHLTVPFTSTLILCVGKKRRLPLEWSPDRGSTLVGPRYAWKY